MRKNPKPTSKMKASSVEPRHGQGLLARVDELEQTLEAMLAEIQPHPELSLQVEAIESSLNTLEGLRSGDGDLSSATAALLSQWLESNRHLAEQRPLIAAHLRMLKSQRSQPFTDGESEELDGAAEPSNRMAH